MTETAQKGDFGMLGDALVKVVGFTGSGKARIRRYKKTKDFFGSIVTSNEVPRRATEDELQKILKWWEVSES